MQKLMFTFLARRKHTEDKELYMYTVLVSVCIFAFVLQTIFLLFYIALPCPPLVSANYYALFGYIVAYFLVENKYFDTAGILLATIISSYCLVAILILGPQYYTFLYFFIVMLIVMVIPFRKKAIKPILVAFQFVFVILSYLLEYNYKPDHFWGINSFGFSLSNIVTVFFAIIILLLLEKSVHNFLESYRQQQMEQLRDQANIDPLTNLYNRRYALQYFEKLENREIFGDNSCIAIADLDSFKYVNDTYGHDEGDIVLRKVSEVLSMKIRKSDLLCRWGGEEFLFIINGVSLEEGYNRLDEIRENISGLFFCYNGHEYHMTITLGVVKLNPLDISKSIKECDEKLYIRKLQVQVGHPVVDSAPS